MRRADAADAEAIELGRVGGGGRGHNTHTIGYNIVV